jgi:uncharacterized membrane protein
MEITFYSWLIVIVAILLIFLAKPFQLKKTIFPIYLVFLIITFFSYLYSIIGTHVAIFDLLGSLWTFTAFGLVLIHSSLSLGNKKTGIFFITAFAFALGSELIGVKYGWIFGHYYYNPINSPFIFGLVPIINVISWLPIIYISYTFANLILEGFGSQKPYIKQSKMLYVILIILLSSIGGLVAVNLDMLLDPVVVSTQGWFWIGGGPFFGVPISNFVGWFFVAFSAIFIFRLYESFKKERDGSLPEKSLLITSSITILYSMYFFIYGFIAFLMGNQALILIGVTTMGPFILITTLITAIDFISKGNNHDRIS